MKISYYNIYINNKYDRKRINIEKLFILGYIISKGTKFQDYCIDSIGKTDMITGILLREYILQGNSYNNL